MVAGRLLAYGMYGSTPMRTYFAILLTSVLLFNASCEEGGSGGGVDRTSKAATLCPVPPDPTVSGCFAQESSQICSPEGCKDLCTGSETPVTCSTTELTGPIPEPASAAGCRILPLPTPSNALFYCCKCGA